jgi:hypothetical protein
MRRTQTVLVALTAAAVLVALAAPAWAASSRSFCTGSKQVRAGHVVPASASPSFDGRTSNYSGCSRSMTWLRTLRQVPIRNAGAAQARVTPARCRPGAISIEKSVRRAELPCRCCRQMASRAATSSRARAGRSPTSTPWLWVSFSSTSPLGTARRPPSRWPGDQQQGGLEAPPAGWLLWSRHVLDGTNPGPVRRQAVVNDQVRVLNWTHVAPLVAWT